MAEKLKSPPRIKVLEALGCIADKRIKEVSNNKAIVVSSDGSRKYCVYVDIEKRIVYSDDNGTKYRRYVGYPIIAFLMIKGYLRYNEDIAKALAGIPWKVLNEKYKNYQIVENIVKEKAKQNGVSPETLDSFVDDVLKQLIKLSLVYDDKYGKCLT
ncbi:hypothetical protein QPL79_02605 [Ignisphaera sp. 4213-co]|uniref:Uncharacterized protein n=1 Tax=Ignisphaera cupida TaxID=3050454 RepID=A0ABD4Z7H3_9CREN|nr:hypothetical protein [Ignisphaera sp. 4213-co]MDK6028255.1 hypothetical protein [Ignisphaera sp. 4213-co]